MSQRSPYNDRNKVEQKGKTRKSASAAKPKRAVADLTPADSPSKPKAKSSAWGRAKAAWKSDGSGVMATVESNPRMKQLRRLWWMLWGTALGIAAAILLMQEFKVNSPGLVTAGWAIWLAAMGGAFYVELVPIRRERASLMAAAKSGGSGKSKKGTVPAAASGDGTSPALDDRQPPSAEGPE